MESAERSRVIDIARHVRLHLRYAVRIANEPPPEEGKREKITLYCYKPEASEKHVIGRPKNGVLSPYRGTVCAQQNPVGKKSAETDRRSASYTYLLLFVYTTSDSGGGGGRCMTAGSNKTRM